MLVNFKNLKIQHDVVDCEVRVGNSGLQQLELAPCILGKAKGENLSSSLCLELGAAASPQVNSQAVLDFPMPHARGSSQGAQGRIVSMALLALGLIDLE